MIEKIFEKFLLKIDDFPKSTENCSIKQFFETKEEHLKSNLDEELQIVLGASKLDLEFLSRIGSDFGLDKVLKGFLIENDIEKSFIECRNIEFKIEKEISSNLYLFVKQKIISLKALYYYKQKKWDNALAITLECNALNDYLVQQGIISLSNRVIEQNKNIASILLRKEKFVEAYTLLFNIFNYLLNGESKNLYGNIFSQNFKKN